MYKIFTSVLLLCFVCSQQLIAQFSPKEGRDLNYRIIGFQFAKGQAESKYAIEIAVGTFNNEDSFKANIIRTFPGDKNRIVVEVPAFGQSYTWRSVTSATNATPVNSELHHFSTLMIPEVDTNVTRLRIIENAKKYNTEYIFFDVTKTLYDMNGRPVWFLPFTKDTNEKRIREMLKRTPWGAVTFLDNGSRDMKCSPLGTITFLNGARGYEVNYDGDVLWTSPKSKLQDSLLAVVDNFNHHDLARLSNGHYMTLGVKVNRLDLPSSFKAKVVPGSEIKKDSITGQLYQRLLTGRVIEYDQDGNIVWEWNAFDYFVTSDLINRKRANGAFKLTNSHENAFYFDEKAGAVYVSFKNLNRIVKVSYPGGKVLAAYGTLYTPGDLELNNDIFCKQHNIRKSMDGLLYMYNNNICNFPCELPSIVMIQEPRTSKEALKKVWEYKCTLDSSSMDTKELNKLRFGIGGSVFELPDRALLCCMGGNYSKTFIVNRDKKILWNALPEVWDATTKKWTPLAAYRSVMISRKELESLIWNEPVNK